MYAISIESSHKRGMGHLYRALNIVKFLQKKKEKFILFLNNDLKSIQIVKEKNIGYVIVDYTNQSDNWEKKLIEKYEISVWILDRFSTDRQMCQNIIDENVLLVGIDDIGSGADLIDLHFYGMVFRDFAGKCVFAGKQYIILNSEINQYKRLRKELNRIIVTLGGSDTYGVTVKIVSILDKLGYGADVVVGPNFQHMGMLDKVINEKFKVYREVPSLIKKFYDYDLAITGGGITCIEANASGLPCIIVANELHEIEIGKYVEQFGGAIFAGYYTENIEKRIIIDSINVGLMSKSALESFNTDGIANIYMKIQEYLMGKKNER